MYITLPSLLSRFNARDVFVLLNDEGYPSVNWNLPSDPIRQRLEQIVSVAEDEMHGYLNDYVIPFEALPPGLSSVLFDIILYRCFSRRVAEAVPGYIAKNYADAVGFLAQVGRGEIRLDAPMHNPVSSIHVAYTKENFLDLPA